MAMRSIFPEGKGFEWEIITFDPMKGRKSDIVAAGKGKKKVGTPSSTRTSPKPLHPQAIQQLMSHSADIYSQLAINIFSLLKHRKLVTRMIPKLATANGYRLSDRTLFVMRDKQLMPSYSLFILATYSMVFNVPAFDLLSPSFDPSNYDPKPPSG